VNAEIIFWEEGRSLVGRDAENTALSRVAYTIDVGCLDSPRTPVHARWLAITPDSG
jgi:hypothetical protein